MEHNAIEFSEISDEELAEYCGSQFSGSSEYEKNRYNQELLGILKAEKYNLKRACELCTRMEKEISMYREFTSKKLSPESLICIKKAWENADRFNRKTDVSDNRTVFMVKEGSGLMSSQDIRVIPISGGYKIILPVLIPHKKMASFMPDYAANYRIPIYNALNREFPDKRPRFINKCNVLIVHHFKNESDMIDYDNFDYTHLINCLASFFWTDDSPKYYRLMIDGTVDGDNHSEILLTDHATNIQMNS